MFIVKYFSLLLKVEFLEYFLCYCCCSTLPTEKANIAEIHPFFKKNVYLAKIFSLLNSFHVMAHTKTSVLIVAVDQHKNILCM